MSNRWFWEKEDGAATVDYVVVMAVMVGLGVAVSETTTGSLTTHTGNVEDELQDGLFETAWDEHLAVQPVLEDDPCDINGDGSVPDDYSGQCYGSGSSGGSGSGTGTGSGTTDPDPDPDPDPTPDPDPDPDPDPTPDPDPDPDPDPTPDPDPDPDPTPDPDPDPDPDPTPPGADGCPTSALSGTPASGTGRGMWSPDRYTVSAGGDTHLSTCTSHNLPGDFGYFDAEPTFTFNLSGLSGYDRLEIETRKNGRSNCDTVLMVRDSFGNWYFDDDSGSNTFSEINISPTSLAEGRVDVWVGTYGSSSCTVTLEMETW